MAHLDAAKNAGLTEQPLLRMSAKSQKPKAKSQKPKAKSQKPKAKSQKPKAKSQKPRGRDSHATPSVCNATRSILSGPGGLVKSTRRRSPKPCVISLKAVMSPGCARMAITREPPLQTINGRAVTTYSSRAMRRGRALAHSR